MTDDDEYMTLAIAAMTRKVATALEAGPRAIEALRQCIFGAGDDAGHGPFCDQPECAASWSWSIPATGGAA